MEKPIIINELKTFITDGENLLSTKWSPSDYGIISFRTCVSYEQYYAWQIKIVFFLESILEKDNPYLINIKGLTENDIGNAKAILKILNDLVDFISRDILIINKNVNMQNNSFSNIELIFEKFHKIQKQLRNRYAKRETIKIIDEYDVQDLLHALLLLYFDDVRKEEWTPSYAGSCARQDFLLKNEKIVIEVKKTRNTMTDRDLGEQLIVDIAKYKAHPDCKHLICFVYDPEGILGNPEGIMNDLNIQNDGFSKVIIQPI